MKADNKLQSSGSAAKNLTGQRSASRKIHPVVIYPFQQTKDYEDVRALYDWIGTLNRKSKRFARPLTVLDRKTEWATGGDTSFTRFKQDKISPCSDLMEIWAVDTCQMWYAGLGAAFERGSSRDVYWLIPGDFNYGTSIGREVLGRLHDLPEIIEELDQDLCIGEIATDHNNSKQLIDTYGTFALLYNWFPSEAQEIRQFTERPRSEFFAVCHSFLGELLAQRWYAYEQTVVMLLNAVFLEKRISRFFVGNISDLPEGRESLASAIQQVERTERVLKSLWRERNQSEAGWIDRYRTLEAKSEEVRRSALTVLQNLLLPIP